MRRRPQGQDPYDLKPYKPPCLIRQIFPQVDIDRHRHHSRKRKVIERLRKPFRLVFLLAVVLGSVGEITQVWALSDICNGLMALPNLLAISVLTPEALDELKKGIKNLKL